MRQYHTLLSAGAHCCAVTNLGQDIASRKWPDEPIDYRQRKLVRTLRDTGPPTLAELARKNVITGQYPGKVVQPIRETGFTEMKLNPAHKRSMLVTLTAAGRAYIDQHDQKVCAFLAKTLFDVSRDDLDVFSRVAGKLRNAFENEYILLEYERTTQVTSR